jgi:hypothetical protein
MATYLGTHDMGGSVTDDQIKSSWETYKTACGKHGCTPMHAHSSAESGRAYCITEANSAGDVQKAHDDAGVAVNEILEVKTLQ